MQAESLQAAVLKTRSASRFFTAMEALAPEAWRAIAEVDHWGRADALGELQARAQRALVGAQDEIALLPALRRLRQREMARIALRAVGLNADLDETLGALSDLADACCTAAVHACYAQLAQRHGLPRGPRGEAAQPIVLGMGKLGGRELNFSSDIDLIFAYSAAGDTQGPRPLSNGEFFTRLVHGVTRLLSERTADGFVFRVDTLLRPFGSVGAPAISAPAMEEYYQTHGREWERYALIKARPVAGDLDAGHRLLEALRPFVYRRYLDFSALENLRNLRRRIDEDAAQRGAVGDLKLGPGGIRELEFIVQLFQLTRGGQDVRLRDARLRPVLRFLGECGQLPEATASGLDAAYVFLRRCENGIQMYADEQLHRLPDTEERRGALCVAMDCPDWAALLRVLDAHRAFVRSEFERLFSGSDAGRAKARAPQSVLDEDLGACEAALRATGYARDPRAAAEAIVALRRSRLARGLSEPSRARLDQVLLWVVDIAALQPDAETALTRTLNVIGSFAGRATYISLLYESYAARLQLVRLAAASPWISTLLEHNPALLDGWLDTRQRTDIPDQIGFRSALNRRAAGIAAEDTEAQLDLLRRYRQEMMLRIADADLAGSLPLVEVSDRLTWLAEAILAQALAFARATTGRGPPLNADGTPAQFAVIGYGKFGSLEMGYGSDLDLVFVYDDAAAGAPAEDPVSGVPPIMYFSRLAQRVVMLLSTLTSSGRAYEIDLELRPSGNSGLVVASLSGFARYQRENAWTWEHQALLRARAVCGDAPVCEAIEGIRREVLLRPRDTSMLRAEIAAMRSKMRSALEKKAPGKWDLKQAKGGLIDAEFCTQFLCLAHAVRHPALIDFTDNWRQLEALAAAGLLDAGECARLLDCERAYRGFLHHRALQQQDPLADEAQFALERAAVTAHWHHSFAENLPT